MKALQRLLTATEKHKPYIAMVIIQFIYTGMSLFSKAAIAGGMKPSVFVAYRQAFATLALCPFALFFESKKSPPLTFKLLGKICLISLFGVTLSLNLYYEGMNYTSATFATAITNTIPAMVFVMAVCLRIERLAITQWHGIAKVLGSVIGLSGAMVFTFFKGPSLYPANGKEISHSSAKVYTKEEWIKGSILMLGANFTWSLWLIMQTPILKQYPAKLRLTTLQCCFSCIISTLYGACVERNVSSWKIGWNVHLFSVAYCGIVVTGLTYWLQVWVVHKKGPVFTSIFSPLALILTAIFSALLFKETLHWGRSVKNQKDLPYWLISWYEISLLIETLNFLNSVLAAVLLVAGLYSFLWGKNKESKPIATGTEEKSPNQVKEDLPLECIVCTSGNNEAAARKEANGL